MQPAPPTRRLACASSTPTRARPACRTRVRRRAATRTSARSSRRAEWWSPIFGTAVDADARFFTAVPRGRDGRPTRSPGTRSTTTGPTASPADDAARDRAAGRRRRRRGRAVELPLRHRPRRHRARRSTGRSTTRCAGGSPIPAGCGSDEVRDHLWVRVVDVAAALAARTYGADDAPRDRARRRVPPREQRPVVDRRWPDGADVRAHRHRRRPRALGARARRALPRRRRRRRRSPRPGGSRSWSGRDRAGPTASSSRTRRRGAPRTSEPPRR